MTTKRLKKLAEQYDNNELVEVAESLDKKGLHSFASDLDRFIDSSMRDGAIDAILNVYTALHQIKADTTSCSDKIQTRHASIRKDNLPKEQRCPFGLPIPNSCMYVGEAIFDMEPWRKAEVKQNKRIYNRTRTHVRCPYAAQIIEEKNAVDCNYGTSTEGRTTPKMYRGSPIYPKLFEGFNSINLDRNYNQFHDFSYYSIYG